MRCYARLPFKAKDRFVHDESPRGSCTRVCLVPRQRSCSELRTWVWGTNEEAAALVTMNDCKRPATTPKPRELVRTAVLHDLVAHAARVAVRNSSQGIQEIRDVVLYPVRLADYHARNESCPLPSLDTPLKGSKDLLVRAHVVNQILLRDFYSGRRGPHLKRWVSCFYVVAEWLWCSYRDGAGPELTSVNRMRERTPIPYDDLPVKYDESSTRAVKEETYMKHVRGDPYQPFEEYVVSSTHPHFETAAASDMKSIRVRRSSESQGQTEAAMECFMEMLTLEAVSGVLDAGSSQTNPLEGATLAGMWSLCNLHDNFSQDPNAFDDPAFWVLQLMNHSLSRNHCYQKMTLGAKGRSYLVLPSTEDIDTTGGRRRQTARLCTTVRYQRMFRALHLIVVQKICLVLRTRFKRLHAIESTLHNRIDPTTFNKAVGFYKSHLNEAEESWRKCNSAESANVILRPKKRQRSMLAAHSETADAHVAAGRPSAAKKRAAACSCKTHSLSSDFLDRCDLRRPSCVPVGRVVANEHVHEARECAFHRVVQIDKLVALHRSYHAHVSSYYEYEKRRVGALQDMVLCELRDAWFADNNAARVGELSSRFSEYGKCVIHLLNGNEKAHVLRKIRNGDAVVKIDERCSSFHGDNEQRYGCRVPHDWVRSITLHGDSVHDMFTGQQHGDLTDVKLYGEEGKAQKERNLLLRLLEELQDIVKIHGTHGGAVHVHLPSLLTCAHRWSNGNIITSDELSDLEQYIYRKHESAIEMNECLTTMYHHAHHAVQAAFCFLLSRSLRAREASRAPTGSDEDVAETARAHLYLMLSVAALRNMRTLDGDEVFFVSRRGLEMHDTNAWARLDWIGFGIMVEIALSAESNFMGRGDVSVSLLPLPAHMVSKRGIHAIPSRLHEATSKLVTMDNDAEARFGTRPMTSFLELYPFEGPRCEQLMRLNWSSYRYLRSNATVEDVPRSLRVHPWKGQPLLVPDDVRRRCTDALIEDFEAVVGPEV